MNSDNNDQLNQSTPADFLTSGVQTRSMTAAQGPSTQPPPATPSPALATQPHLSAAEVILSDHINTLGMELAQAVINQNNSLTDSILTQIHNARTALLTLSGNTPAPSTNSPLASDASRASSSSTTFSMEKRTLSCMDKLPLWKTGHDPLLFLNDFKETCDGFSINLADKNLRKRLFKFVFKKDPSLRAGVDRLLETTDTWNDLSNAFTQDRLGTQWKSSLRNKIHQLT